MITQSECEEMRFTIFSTRADKVCRYCSQSFMQTSARKVAILNILKLKSIQIISRILYKPI